MKREWKIRVGSKDKTIAEFSVPMYRLDGGNLSGFLRALVIKQKNVSPEQMLDFYLNDRQGKSRPRQDAEIISYFHYESRENGYWCGTWEAYASATCEISQEEADAVNYYRQQNRNASEKISA